MKTNTTLIALLFLLSAYSSKGREEERPGIDFCFKENKGQLIDQQQRQRQDIIYYGSNNALSYYFKRDGFSYQLYRQEKNSDITIARVDVSWKGCNTDAKIVAEDQGPVTESYYTAGLGEGITDILSFRNLRYQGIYDGIDLHYYHKDTRLKYDFIVAPFADYKKIRLAINGANDITLKKDGSVSIMTPLGEISEGRPLVFQDEKALKASWVLEGNELSFQVWDYDRSKPLVIDPMIYLWHIANGQGLFSSQYDVSENSLGTILSVGVEYGLITSPFTSQAAHVATQSAPSGYVGNTGQVRIYAAMSNPPLPIAGYGIAHANDAVAFFCGAISAGTNVVTTGAYQTTVAGQTDGFLARFSNFGSTITVTYYGGTGNDTARSCRVDDAGNIYVCGSTTSSDNMSSPGSLQPALAGVRDAFIAKFSSLGQRVWGTYFGAAGSDQATNVAVRGNRLFLSGSTQSATGMATPGAHQPALNGTINGFLLCMDTSGNRIWSTYYGADSTLGENCNVDTGFVYLCGSTNATTGIATAGAHQPALGGGFDAYLAKFDMNGVRQWGTYYGGPGNETGKGNSIVVDGKMYMSGSTNSTTGITTANAYNTAYNPNAGGASAAYIAEMDTAGHRVYGTYINFMLSGEKCFTNGNGFLNVAGNYIPTDITRRSASVARFKYTPDSVNCSGPVPVVTASGTNLCPGSSIQLSTPAAGSYKWYNGNILISGATDSTYTVTQSGTYRVRINNCMAQTSSNVIVIGRFNPSAQAFVTNIPCYDTANSGAISVTVTSGLPPYSYTWTGLPNTTADVSGLAPGTYTVQVTDGYGCDTIVNATVARATTIAPSDPLVSICGVTVDSVSGRNRIVWEKLGNVKAVSYRVYRESSVSGVYDLLGTNGVQDPTTFVDNTAIPSQQSYNYKIAEVDSCGNEWPLSGQHRTIRLSATVGSNGEVNLAWSAYEGRPYSTFYIERSTAGAPFVLVNPVASGTLSYSDLTPPSGVNIYRITIDLPAACTPSGANELPRVSSNQVVVGTSSIPGISGIEGIILLPNPTTGLLRVLNFKPAAIKVYDFAGRQVLSEKNTASINLAGLSKGTYLVRLLDKDANVQYSKKVVLK